MVSAGFLHLYALTNSQLLGRMIVECLEHTLRVTAGTPRESSDVLSICRIRHSISSECMITYRATVCMS
jgi:hypothetical protein